MSESFFGNTLNPASALASPNSEVCLASPNSQVCLAPPNSQVCLATPNSQVCLATPNSGTRFLAACGEELQSNYSAVAFSSLKSILKKQSYIAFLDQH